MLFSTLVVETGLKTILMKTVTLLISDRKTRFMQTLSETYNILHNPLKAYHVTKDVFDVRIKTMFN